MPLKKTNLLILVCLQKQSILLLQHFVKKILLSRIFDNMHHIILQHIGIVNHLLFVFTSFIIKIILLPFCLVWGGARGAPLCAQGAPECSGGGQGGSDQQSAPVPGASDQAGPNMFFGGPAGCFALNKQQTHTGSQKVSTRENQLGHFIFFFCKMLFFLSGVLKLKNNSVVFKYNIKLYYLLMNMCTWSGIFLTDHFQNRRTSATSKIKVLRTDFVHVFCTFRKLFELSDYNYLIICQLMIDNVHLIQYKNYYSKRIDMHFWCRIIFMAFIENDPLDAFLDLHQVLFLHMSSVWFFLYGMKQINSSSLWWHINKQNSSISSDHLIFDFIAHTDLRPSRCRLEAELEKQQNSSKSADTTLFSTPCWNTTSPWEHSGTVLKLYDLCVYSH